MGSDSDKWEQLLAQVADQSAHEVDKSKRTNPDVWEHASQHDIADTARLTAIKYAQWSRAVELAQIAANGTGDAKQLHQCTGRGLMPKLQWQQPFLSIGAPTAASALTEHLRRRSLDRRGVLRLQWQQQFISIGAPLAASASLTLSRSLA